MWIILPWQHAAAYTYRSIFRSEYFIQGLDTIVVRFMQSVEGLLLCGCNSQANLHVWSHRRRLPLSLSAIHTHHVLKCRINIRFHTKLYWSKIYQLNKIQEMLRQICSLFAYKTQRNDNMICYENVNWYEVVDVSLQHLTWSVRVCGFDPECWHPYEIWWIPSGMAKWSCNKLMVTIIVHSSCQYKLSMLVSSSIQEHSHICPVLNVIAPSEDIVHNKCFHDGPRFIPHTQIYDK